MKLKCLIVLNLTWMILPACNSENSGQPSIQNEPAKHKGGNSVLPKGHKATATPKKLESKVNSIGIEMVKIPSGEFLMAGCEMLDCSAGDSSKKKRRSPECRALRKECQRGRSLVPHTVTLTHSFYIGKTEITQKQYSALINQNPSRFKAKQLGRPSDNHPAENIDWFDAIKFANALSIKEGLPKCYSDTGDVIDGSSVYACKGYRLPTEAEWEYAARAGTQGARYGKIDEIAWYQDNSDKKTQPVAQKSANAFGLYDMLGNVSEWCHDRYEPYTSKSRVNPEGAASGKARIVRGGSWYYYNQSARSFDRRGAGQTIGGSDQGFRLARSVMSP